MTAVGYVCQRICFCLLSVWLSAFWVNGAEVYPQTMAVGPYYRNLLF